MKTTFTTYKRNYEGEMLCDGCGQPIGENKEVKKIMGRPYHKECAFKIEQKMEERGI